MYSKCRQIKQFYILSIFSLFLELNYRLIYSRIFCIFFFTSIQGFENLKSLVNSSSQILSISRTLETIDLQKALDLRIEFINIYAFAFGGICNLSDQPLNRRRFSCDFCTFALKLHSYGLVAYMNFVILEIVLLLMLLT